jgi:hypothetical protein
VSLLCKDIDCFCLSAGGKICYFDCHRCFIPFNHPFRRQRKEFRKGTIIMKGPPKRRSGIEITQEHRKLVLDESGKRYQGFGEEHNWNHICGLWELPYAKSLILMHNINVMHQESNFYQALINTCMDFPDKTKDNDKARMDLAVICDRPTQVLRENGGKPKADYCLKPKQRKEVMKWMKDLKFLDGYAAVFRRSMNLKKMKMNVLKSHDFHIIMERLMHVMFRGYIYDVVWKTLAEVSYFYRQLCAKKNQKICDGTAGERGTGAFCANWKKYFHRVSSFLCSISLYIFHMRLRSVVLFSTCGCFL